MLYSLAKRWAGQWVTVRDSNQTVTALKSPSGKLLPISAEEAKSYNHIDYIDDVIFLTSRQMSRRVAKGKK